MCKVFLSLKSHYSPQNCKLFCAILLAKTSNLSIQFFSKKSQTLIFNYQVLDKTKRLIQSR